MTFFAVAGGKDIAKADDDNDTDITIRVGLNERFRHLSCRSAA